MAFRRTNGSPCGIAPSLEDFGVLASLEGRYRCTARLLGAAEAAARGFRTIPPISVAEDYWPAIAAARAALGDTDFAAAWAEGGAMAPEEAADRALNGDLEVRSISTA